MRYAGLIGNDVANGNGVCVSVWLQGCPIHCKGCHNPDTWDFNGGIEIDPYELIDKTVKALTANGVNRNLSILGGEPLCKENLEFTIMLMSKVKELFPEKKIYLWTGFTYEYLTINLLQYADILKLVDVLIAGPFIQELRDITLKLRGSKNQEIFHRNNIGALVLDIDSMTQK